MKKFLEEFKEFALKGNAFDLAVGVLIGGAFQGIVKSLTDNIISPILGLFTATDLSGWEFTIFGADIRYGAFLTSVINFILMALVIFLVVKGINKITSLGSKFHKGEEKEEPAPTTKTCPYCKSEIAIDAVRCPHCTSVLEAEEEAAE